MTLASAIITRAYRESNLIPMNTSPTAAQTTEGLDRLNSLLLSTVGNEAGDDLIELSIGGDFDESDIASDWIPDNARLMLQLASDQTLYLDPYPKNGQRVAVVDIDGNLATYNVTLNGNGRLIEGAATLVLSTNSLVRQWMYRSDTGNWVRITTLASGDTIPFPEEFDEYFVKMLALSINPLYGQTLSAETLQQLQRARKQLCARYAIRVEHGPDVPYLETDYRTYGRFTNDEFDKGIPRRWR